jgi:uncharacterized protein
MKAYFLDSSGLVKRYAKEKGTAFVIGLLKPSARNQLYAARIAFVEVVSALARRHRGGSLDAAQFAKSDSGGFGSRANSLAVRRVRLNFRLRRQ